MKFKTSWKGMIIGFLAWSPLEIHAGAGLYGQHEISSGNAYSQIQTSNPTQGQADPALLAKNLGIVIDKTNSNSVLLAAETSHCDIRLLRALSSREVLGELHKEGTSFIFFELSKVKQRDLIDAANDKITKIDGLQSGCGDKIGAEQSRLIATLASNAHQEGIVVLPNQPIFKTLKLAAAAFNAGAMSVEAAVIRPFLPKLANLWENVGEELVSGVDLNDRDAAEEVKHFADYGTRPIVYGGALHAFATTSDSFKSVLGAKAMTLLWSNGSDIPAQRIYGSEIPEQKLSGCDVHMGDSIIAVVGRPDFTANVVTGVVTKCAHN